MISRPEEELELVKRALAGEKEAWDALFFEILEPYINGLVGKAFLPVHPDLFEEAVHEAVFQVYTNLGKFRGEARITTWCYFYVMGAISRNWKSVQRARCSEEIEEISRLGGHRALEVHPEEDLERHYLRRRLEDALDGMNPVYRRAIELQAFEGLSVQEISERTGASQNTVKSWIKRARQKLKEHFDGA